MNLKQLLAILLVAGLASAGCPVQPVSYEAVCSIKSFDDCSDATAFITVAFMLVSLVIALAYMYSKVKESAAIGVWAKDEAANLLISVFLFAGMLAFFQASCSVAYSYADANPFQAANTYLERLIQSNGMNVLRDLTYSSLDNQFTATQYWYFGMTPFYGTGVAEFANNRALSAHKEFVIDLYIPLLASLNMQKLVLQALQWVGASLLLPFAFVMRLIPPTREFGNVMIAIFFAIYVVVPTTYVLSGQAFENIVKNQACVNCAVHNFYSFGMDGGDGSDGGAHSSAVWQNALFYKIGSTIPQAVFLPNLVLIIAITCVMSLSKALRAIAV
jgi:hypothetical protein